METLHSASMILVMKRSDEALHVSCPEFGELDPLVGREEGIWVTDARGKASFLGLGWGEVIDVCSGVSRGVIDPRAESIPRMICFGEVCALCDFGRVVPPPARIPNLFRDSLHSRGGCL